MKALENVAFGTYMSKVPAPNLDNCTVQWKAPTAVQIQTSIVSLMNCILKTGGEESQLHSHSMKKSPV